MMKLKNRFFENNRGSTLVEVIVSVLVVGIVFVPLMFGLSTATKVNDQAENKMYGETVAANCLEAVKTLGIYGDEITFSGSGSSTLTGDFTKYLNDNVGIELTGTGAKCDAFGSGAVVSKAQNSDGTYVVTNLKEGVDPDGTGNRGVYYAVITIDNDAYENANSLEYETVDPISDSVQCNMASDFNSRAVIQVKGMAENRSGTAYTEAAAKALIKGKTTYVEFGQKSHMDDTAPDKYYVSAQNCYLLDNEDHKVSAVDEEEYKLILDGDESKFTNCPASVALFYSPMASSANTVNKGSVEDVIEINKTIDKPLDVYVFVSGTYMSGDSDNPSNPYDGAKLKVKVTDVSTSDDNQVTVHCVMGINKVSGSFETSNTVVKKSSGTQMARIKVEVYDSSNNFVSEKITSITY